MGSGISFNTFVDRAKLSEGSDMRLSRDGSELVNKGTLGQKIASFFTSIGQALGLVKEMKGNEAADRQAMALKGFREALSQRFDPTVANEVLKDTGKFTGKFVLETVQKAEEHSGKVRDHNAGIDSKEQLNSAMTKFSVGQESLTDGQRIDFHRHFNDLKYNALEGNLHKLEGPELAGIAEDALRLALGNQRAINSDRVKGHVDEMKSALKGNYEFNGGKEFDKVWKKVDEQLQTASTAVLKGPKGGLSASDRKDLMDDMKNAMEDSHINPRAKDNALAQFNNVLGGLRLYREEPPRA